MNTSSVNLTDIISKLYVLIEQHKTRRIHTRILEKYISEIYKCLDSSDKKLIEKIIKVEYEN